jgi:hypothetical protein
MKKILLFVLVLISINSLAQNPTNYYYRSVRERMISLMMDSTFHLPRYNGTPSGIRTGASTQKGALAVDTVSNTIYLGTGYTWTPLTGTNIYNSNGILAGNRALTGNNNTYGLQFDSLNNFQVSRNGIARITMNSTTSQITSPDGLNSVYVNNAWSSLDFNGSANYIRTINDSSLLHKRISYEGNIHSTFYPYSLVDKSYVDSLVEGGTPTLNQVANSGSIRSWSGSGNGITLSGTGADNSSAAIQITQSSFGMPIYLTNQHSSGIFQNKEWRAITYERDVVGGSSVDGIGIKQTFGLKTVTGFDTAVYLVAGWKVSNHTNRTSYYDIRGVDSGTVKTMLQLQPDYLIFHNGADTIASKADVRTGGGGSGGTVTSVAAGFGTSFSTITTTGSVIVDTTSGGVLSWVRGKKIADSLAAISGSAGWGLTGNALTAGSQAGSFIGSTNNVSMRFRTNNIQRAIFDSIGHFSFGGEPNLNRLNATDSAHMFEIINDNTSYQVLRISTYGPTASLQGQNNIHWVRMGGTAASPSATQSGDAFFSNGTRGYGTSQTAESSSAFSANATENFTNSAHGTKFRFETTPNGSNTRSQIVELGNGANINIPSQTLLTQQPALKIAATLPSSPTSDEFVVNVQATSAGSTQNNYGINVDLLAGATGSVIYTGARFANNVAGTGANLVGVAGNYGNLNNSDATTTGYNVGSYNYASNGNMSVGVVGRAITAKNSATNIGGAFFGRNTGSSPIHIGVYAGFNSTDPTFVSAALLADNSDRTDPIFLARDNGTIVFGIKDGGSVDMAEISAPSTPASSFGRMYVSSSDSKFHFISDGGIDYDLTATSQGADVASAVGAIALGNDGHAFEITGTNAITLISNVGWRNGSEVTLWFTSTASLTDGTANSGTNIGLELNANTNFTGSAGASITLQLIEIGGTQRWREKCRSVN